MKLKCPIVSILYVCVVCKRETHALLCVCVGVSALCIKRDTMTNIISFPIPFLNIKH